MKHLSVFFVAVWLLAGVTGCDWEWNDSDDGWSDSYSWVNFAGTYRGNNSYLVSDYSLTASTTTTDTSANTSTFQDGPWAVAALNTVFSGVLTYKPVSGSVTIIAYSAATSAAAGTLRDNGSGGLTGSYNKDDSGLATYTASGTIDYTNGRWTVTLSQAGGFARAVNVYASYTYSTSSGTNTGGTSTSTSAASGKSIYSFVVSQDGQKIYITDNNGAVYSGKFGTVSFTADQLDTGTSTSGTSGSTTTTTAGEVIASFTATGTSAAGYAVTITGTFQGYYTSAARMINRIVTGTWVVTNGKTGNGSGKADASASTVTTTTTTTGTTTTQ